MYFFSLLEQLAFGEDTFYVMARRIASGQFTFESALIDKINFPTLNFSADVKDLTNFQCLSANVNSNFTQLDLFITDCSEQHTIICRKLLFVKPDCTKPSIFKNKSSFTVLLDPNLKLEFKKAIAYKKAEIVEMIQRLNMAGAYQSMFSTLWYSTYPCSNILKFGTSFLRYCEWKGIRMPCSSIFTAFPTDKGMCCSFNMKAAEDIYVETTFRNMLKQEQIKNRNISIESSTLLPSYIVNKEPKTAAGKKQRSSINA